MITCDKKFLFFRAAERGYKISEVMPCVVSREGDQWTIDENHPAYPATKKPALPEPPSVLGLGDMVAAGLSAVGITEDRVSAVVGRPCGCGKRKAVLNSLGAAFLGLPEGSTADSRDATDPAP